MDGKQALTGLKKRQQIHNAGRMVFIWVAIASVVVAVAAVLSQFMIKEFLYNAKVIGALNATNDRLQKNISAYPKLKDEVTKLVSHKELTALRADPADSALQTVIDAMPTVDDRVALATSLQQRILSRSGVVIESLSTTQSDTSAFSTLANPLAYDATPVVFHTKVTGSYEQIRGMFRDLQLSIRPIGVLRFQLSGNGKNLQAEFDAITYYAPARTVQLKEETVAR